MGQREDYEDGEFGDIGTWELDPDGRNRRREQPTDE